MNEGNFYLVPVEDRQAPSVPPIFEYARLHGAWEEHPGGSDADPSALVQDAGLNWHVTRHPVYTSSSDTLTGLGDVLAQGYKALVREDTGTVLGVVTSDYAPIQNQAAARTVTLLAQRAARSWGLEGDHEPRLAAAAPYGRDRSRGVYVVDLGLSGGRSFLIARNGHGDGSAFAIDYVEIDDAGTVVPIDAPGAGSVKIREGHLGRIRDRLARRSSSVFAEGWGERLVNVLVDWAYTEDWPASRRTHEALVAHLWPGDQSTNPRPYGAAVHPREHLLVALEGAGTLGLAYRTICHYIDHDSEARERGDATKDRLERLAAGAGTRIKERALAWLTSQVAPEPDDMP
ncbi:MAG: hypothetical protein WA892_02665 [Ornithinimicrobium sp.]